LCCGKSRIPGLPERFRRKKPPESGKNRRRWRNQEKGQCEPHHGVGGGGKGRRPGTGSLFGVTSWSESAPGCGEERSVAGRFRLNWPRMALRCGGSATRESEKTRQKCKKNRTRGLGFEPRQTEPKSVVLPLHYPRMGGPVDARSCATV
jgi:hypothetical protein